MSMLSTSSNSLQTLLQLFKNGFRHNPERLAVKFDDGFSRTSQLTYAQVKNDVHIIVKCLASFKVAREIIGCSSETHVAVPSVILGILESSAAFFFLDLADLNIRETITQACVQYILVVDTAKFNQSTDIVYSVVSTVALHSCNLNLIKLHGVCVKKWHFPRWELAYVVQSSGTTGHPKLIKVPHRCIVPNVTHFRNIYGVRPTDVVFVASPLTFDPSIVDIFLALSTGASILLVPECTKMMPHRLADTLIVRNRVTIMQVTPSLMKRFGAITLKNDILGPGSPIRILGFGGEQCPGIALLSTWKDIDNKTDIYNVYGISEVSSWATIHHIDTNPRSEYGYEEDVPLGDPIPGTEIAILDRKGMSVKRGEGQIFLGGSERICFIGWEDCSEVSKCPLRATGDWVRVDERGHVFYVCRMDDVVKRNGKRVSLRQLEKAVLSCEDISDGKAIWNKDEGRLILAAITDASTVDSKEKIIAKLRQHMISYGVSHIVPDDVILLDLLPVTAHGKLDKCKVIKLANLQASEFKQKNLDSTEICETFKDLWKTYLASCSCITETDNFLLSGGDSIKVVSLCEELQQRLEVSCPFLMDKILNDTFAEALQYLLSVVLKNTCPSAVVVPDTCLEEQRLKLCPDDMLSSARVVPNESVRMSSRGSNLKYLMCSVNNERGGLVADKLWQKDNQVAFSLVWSYDTGKCIDASPLVVCSKINTAYIGSHSHCISAVDLESGKAKWTFKTANRIESSACSSFCGAYVFVGSYDEHLYCLDSQSGEVVWKFKSNGMIKSSPTVDPLNKQIYFGSHDHFVYALKLQSGSLCWSQKPSKGSVFSSPCISVIPYHLYVGTLDGLLCALCPKFGQKVWSFNCGMPIFSSPTLVPDGVCFGSVNSMFYCCSHEGVKLWHFKCEGPIFSSPCFASHITASILPLVLIGSHDCRVYCLYSSGGQLCWSCTLDSAIYSTPFVEDDVVYVCTTAGHLYALCLKEGTVLGTFAFPGNVFSSPLVTGSNLIVGCRDNHLYCLHIDKK